MQSFEMSLQWRLVQLGEKQQLRTTKQIAAHMVGAFGACATVESLWVLCFSVNRWVIGHTCVRQGVCVTAWPYLREVARIAILADARGLALVRGEPGENVGPTPGDMRLVKHVREAARALEIEWIDYLIISTHDDAEKLEYYSESEHG